MADGDGATAPAGHSFDFAELAGDRRRSEIVVEEHIARGVRYPVGRRQVEPDAPGRRPRIEKDKATGAQFLDDRSHCQPISGKFAAHMVVDADIAVEAAEPPE